MQDTQPSGSVGAGKECIAELLQLQGVGDRHQERFSLCGERRTEAATGQAGEQVAGFLTALLQTLLQTLAFPLVCPAFYTTRQHVAYLMQIGHGLEFDARQSLGEKNPIEPHGKGPPQAGLLRGLEPLDQGMEDCQYFRRRAAGFEPEERGTEVAPRQVALLGHALLVEQELRLAGPVFAQHGRHRFDQVVEGPRSIPGLGPIIEHDGEHRRQQACLTQLPRTDQVLVEEAEVGLDATAIQWSMPDWNSSDR